MMMRVGSREAADSAGMEMRNDPGGRADGLSPAVRPAALAPGTAAVWWLPLDAVPDPAWRRWHALLDAEEAARAARFYFEADRRQFIAAHALARSMLSAF